MNQIVSLTAWWLRVVVSVFISLSGLSIMNTLMIRELFSEHSWKYSGDPLSRTCLAWVPL